MGINMHNFGLILGLLAIALSIVGVVSSLLEGDYTFGENELGLVVGALLVVFYFSGGMKRDKK